MVVAEAISDSNALLAALKAAGDAERENEIILKLLDLNHGLIIRAVQQHTLYNVIGECTFEDALQMMITELIVELRKKELESWDKEASKMVARVANRVRGDLVKQYADMGIAIPYTTRYYRHQKGKLFVRVPYYDERGEINSEVYTRHSYTEDMEQPTIDNELKDIIHATFESAVAEGVISDAERDIFYSRVLDGIKYEDIAKAYDKTPDAIRQCYIRTRAKIKRYILEKYPSARDYI